MRLTNKRPWPIAWILASGAIASAAVAQSAIAGGARAGGAHAEATAPRLAEPALSQMGPAQVGPSKVGPPQVWVARRGWHIDLGLAVEDLRGPLRSVAAHFPAARYVFFGFGDRRYLTAKHHGSSTLAAALWPGAGLMLVTAIEGDPRQAFGEGHALALPLQEHAAPALQDFVWRSFETENQSAQVIQQGPYDGSLYFAALPRYSGLHTCNTWAAEGLAAAQLPIRHRFVLLAGQLWSQATQLGSQLTSLSRPGDRAAPSLAGAVR